MEHYYIAVLRIRIRDPVLFLPLDLRIRDGKKFGSGRNIPDHFSYSLGTVFRAKNV
jgi:hypothetical protein